MGKKIRQSKKRKTENKNMDTFTTNKNNVQVLQLTRHTIYNIIELHRVSLLLFYTDWCCFSKEVLPVFEEVASLISKRYPYSGYVVLGKINCDDEKRLVNNQTQFSIGCYPTIKVASRGKVLNHTYYGKRSVQNFVNLIEKCLKDPNFNLNETKSWQ